MCNCKSYNWQIGEEQDVILDPNEYFCWDTPARTVCVDACIADQIKMLWENKIWTVGCCCGHGNMNPDVIISEGADPEEAKCLLKKNDPNRKWDVLQWQLVTT